jgi:hypothetical protein
MFPIVFNLLKLHRKGPSLVLITTAALVAELHYVRITFEVWRVAPLADFVSFCCVVTNSTLVLPTYSQFYQHGNHANRYVGAIVSSRHVIVFLYSVSG